MAHSHHLSGYVPYSFLSLSTRNPAVERRHRHPQVFRYVLGRHSPGKKLLGRFHLAFGHAALAATDSPPLPGGIQTGAGSFRNQFPFHLGQTRHHVKEESPAWAGRVDVIREAVEVDLSRFQVIHQVHQGLQAAPQAIQLPDHQAIALAEMGERNIEPRPVLVGPAHAILEHLFTARFFKRLNLKIQVLVFGGNASYPISMAFSLFLKSRVRGRELRGSNQERFLRKEFL